MIKMLPEKYHFFSYLLFPSSFSATGTCSAKDRSKLNKSFPERLYIGTPLSLPCFSSFDERGLQREAVACSTLQQKYTSSSFRIEYYGGYMISQDEIYISNVTDQCLLDNANPYNPLAYSDETSDQGSVSPFYIDMRDPEDITETFQVSRDAGTKVVVENNGQGYLGRSNLKGSLILGTYNLKRLLHYSNISPEGCTSIITTYKIIIIGAGVNFDEVYKYANQENIASTGASGGWILRGDHFVLRPVYGLGVDRVVQFKLVTLDGVLWIAGHCQNEGLFWALRKEVEAPSAWS